MAFIQEYVSKKFLKDEYKDAYEDLQLALHEDTKWECRKLMAKLEATAFDCGYGEEFVEEMRKVIK